MTHPIHSTDINIFPLEISNFFDIKKYIDMDIDCILILNGIKVRVCFEKNIEKKPLCRHDKNYYYFCKSNIPVINLIAGSRTMIKVSKNTSFEKIRSTTRVVFTKY